MSGGIFLLREGDELVELTERTYDSERLLQELLESHPALLSGNQVDPGNPRRWLLINRETSVPSTLDGGGRWSLDHLFIDQDGTPTLIEVKRSTDTRIRREVVGQMLDYAANAVAYWPVQSLQEALKERCNQSGIDHRDAVAALIGPDGDHEVFWKSVQTNLQAGRIRLVFVADILPPELRRVIEFLNEQMNPAEVLGLEVRQYVGPGVRSLVPRVIGRTEHAQQKKSTTSGASGRQWSEATFLTELAARFPDDVTTARQILDWAKRTADSLWFGKGERSGSIYPVFGKASGSFNPIALWTYGSVEIQFQTLQLHAPFDRLEMRQAFLRRLNSIPGVSISDDRLGARPAIALSSLRSSEARGSFIDTVDWVVSAVREAQATGRSG